MHNILIIIYDLFSAECSIGSVVMKNTASCLPTERLSADEWLARQKENRSISCNIVPVPDQQESGVIAA